MTEEQLAELHRAWPGDWQRVADPRAWPTHTLPPTAAGWTPGAGTMSTALGAVLVLRRPGHQTVTDTGATFAGAAKSLRAKLRKHAEELQQLAAEVPKPGRKTAGRRETPAGKTPRKTRRPPPVEFRGTIESF